ncbi:MAG: retropepsin-like aspartic protease [Gammaproteobacteria bacterium]
MKVAFRVTLIVLSALAACSPVHERKPVAPDHDFDRLQKIVRGVQRGKVPSEASNDRATNLLALGLRERTHWQFRKSGKILRQCTSLETDTSSYSSTVHLLCLAALAGNQYTQGHYHQWAGEILHWMKEVALATSRLSPSKSAMLRQQLAKAVDRPLADFDGYLKNLRTMAQIMQQLPAFSAPGSTSKQTIKLETYPATKYQFVAKGIRNGHKTKQKYRWTITFDPDFPAIRVKCGGTKFLMSLDSGSSLTTLSEKTAKRLGVRATPAPMALAALKGGYARVQIGVIPKLEIGEFTFRNLPVAVVGGPPAIGDSIGLTTLLQLGSVALDHARQTMTVFPAVMNTPRAGMSMRLTSKLVGNDPRIVFIAHHQGTALNIQIDTGNSGKPVGHAALLDAIPGLIDGIPLHKEDTFATQVNVGPKSVATIPEFSLVAGPWHSRIKDLTVFPEHSIPGHVAISTSERDFLREGAILSLDFRRGTMAITTPERQPGG